MRQEEKGMQFTSDSSDTDYLKSHDGSVRWMRNPQANDTLTSHVINLTKKSIKEFMIIH